MVGLLPGGLQQELLDSETTDGARSKPAQDASAPLTAVYLTDSLWFPNLASRQLTWELSSPPGEGELQSTLGPALSHHGWEQGHGRACVPGAPSNS